MHLRIVAAGVLVGANVGDDDEEFDDPVLVALEEKIGKFADERHHSLKYAKNTIWYYGDEAWRHLESLIQMHCHYLRYSFVLSE